MVITPMTSQNILIYSLNVNGIGDNKKRKAIFRSLHKVKKGIFLLQETHSSKESENIWRNEWGSKEIFFSHGELIAGGYRFLLHVE